MSASKLQLMKRDVHPPRLDRELNYIDCVVDAERKLVVVKFRKRLSFKEIEAYTQLLRANPLFKPAFSEIADISRVEEIDLQADEFLKLADERDPFAVDAKRAFVTQNSVQNHAARMHKLLRGRRNIEIFSTMEAAEEWVKS